MNPALKFIGSKWVAATHTRNYMLNNCIADCIYELEKSQFPSSSSNSNSSSTSSSTSFIMEQGNIFERKIYEEIKRKFQEKVVDIKGKARSVVDFERTRDEMLINRTPIILGGVLHDDKEKIFGCPDILIRVDYLDKLFTSVKSNLGAETRRVEYAVIDVKFSTLSLMCDGTHILNSGFYPAYKSQVEIYRRIVNKVCNTNYNYGFILGRGVTYTSKSIKNTTHIRDSFFTPGVIDYSKKDLKFVKKTTEAIKWVKRVRSIKRPELETLYTDPKSFIKKYPLAFPNMCYANDFPNIAAKKKEINEVVKDITQLWMCSNKHRELALSLTKGRVSSWDHPEFSTHLINLKGKTNACVDHILKVNRDSINSYTVTYNEELSFENKLPKKRVFIDFEVLTDIAADDSFSQSIIFMIGIYYENEFNKELSKTFSIDFGNSSPRTLLEMESLLILKFIEYVKENNLQDYTFIHWSPAENWQWVSVCKKIESISTRNFGSAFKFFDLCKYLQDSAFAVQGCFNYGLKSVAKSLYNLGYIQTTWKSSGGSPSDGLDAVVNFYKAYKTGDVAKINKEIQKIEEYNKVDVIVLYEICNFINNF